MHLKRSMQLFLIILALLIFPQQWVYGDLFTYDSKEKRDPFIPSWKGGSITQGGTEVSLENIHLEGIVWDNHEPIAIINGTLVIKGGKIGSFILQSIGHDRIVLNEKEREHIIHLVE
jgi:hypothetical protein